MKRVTITIAPFAFLVLAALPLQAAEMKDTQGMKTGASKTTAEQTHKGSGTVKSVDAKAGNVRLAHGAIPSVKWPAMTMDFQVKDKSLYDKLVVGKKIEFAFVQQGSNYVVTNVE